MTPSREDLELYVTGNYEGDVDALERAIVDDPAAAAIVAKEARLEELLRDAAAAAMFCIGCSELVRRERCDNCGVAVRPGGYLVERVLVANAHGRMYVARDADGKRVALKELAFVHAPSPAALAAFEREARFLQALEHPAIPRFVAAFEEGSGVHTRYYLAQELVEGKALDRIEDHWYTESEIVDIAKQVLGVLVYLQSLSPMVIHRDIKPANLLKRPDGSIALVDFGAAHVYGTTAGSTTIGTFGYMPIEQLAGIVDTTTDVFALGATLLNLLTREEPWKLAQTKASVNVSAPLRAFLDKLTAADPRERFSSAKEALAALENRDAIVVAPANPAKVTRKRRRMWPLAIAAASALAAGGGIAAFHALTPEEVPDPGYVHVTAGPHDEFTVSVDGEMWGNASYDTTIRLNPGVHNIKLVGERGETCSDEVRVRSGLTEALECPLPKGRSPVGLKIGQAVTPPLDLPTVVTLSRSASTELDDVVRDLADSCSVNIVMRALIGREGRSEDRIAPGVVINADNVRCDEAITALLESRGLSYFYNPDAQLIRIGRREELFASAAPDQFKGQLPPGHRVSLNVKDEDVRKVLQQIARAERINLIVPDNIRGRVTARLKDVPWNQAFEAVLESQSLWYRHSKDSNSITVLVNLNVGPPPSERFERFRSGSNP